jgi:hypothetical protein
MAVLWNYWFNVSFNPIIFNRMVSTCTLESQLITYILSGVQILKEFLMAQYLDPCILFADDTSVLITTSNPIDFEKNKTETLRNYVNGLTVTYFH